MHIHIQIRTYIYLHVHIFIWQRLNKSVPQTITIEKASNTSIFENIRREKGVSRRYKEEQKLI